MLLAEMVKYIWHCIVLIVIQHVFYKVGGGSFWFHITLPLGGPGLGCLGQLRCARLPLLNNKFCDYRKFLVIYTYN